MSSEKPSRATDDGGLARGVTRPAAASHGDPGERLLAVWFVGVATGLVTAMATYPLRFQLFTLPWATESLLGGAVLVSGALVKWLVEQMRASIASFLLSAFVGAVALVGFQLAPYYLTGSASFGLRVYVPLRDVVTFLIMIQFPLQLVGYLSVVVYDGYRA
jgi:hypothetical protein